MQITRVATGAGMPHGKGHSNSWKDFSTSDYSGTIYRGGYVYYRCSKKFSSEKREAKSLGTSNTQQTPGAPNSSKLRLDKRKAKSLHKKTKVRKFRKLMENVQIC
ncbi:MAG: hypothetical protein WBA52_02080 [Dolichospermum sp.]